MIPIIKSGFFNAMKTVAGTYDRTYSADDYCENLAAIISNGVVRSVADDFRITANGMVPSANAGRAWINGHWVKSDAVYPFNTVSAPTGYNRYDAIFLRLNTSISGRNVELVYVEGTAAANPVAPEPIRNDEIYDICLAHLYVVANARELVIIDTRSNEDLCGWVYSTAGDNSFFTSLDNQFDSWFVNVKDTVATTTTEIEYKQLTVLEELSDNITITIPQYDSNVNQKLNVYVNGLLTFSPDDYTVNGSLITFTNPLIAGTEIIVAITVGKDGSGISTALEDVVELQNKVAALENGLMNDTYNYVCNGVNDNVRLSEIAQEWLDGGDDYSSLKVNVFGNLVVSTPFAGDGSATSPYRWFSLGSGTTKKRRITFDFSGCSQITLKPGDGTNNIIFFGFEVNVIGANVVASGNANIYAFTTATNTVANAERCRFIITANNGYVARSGHFKDCFASITISSGNGYVFYPADASLLRIDCGEYYAYSPSTTTSAVVRVDAAATNAVVITSGMNAPVIAKTGYTQDYSISCLSNNAKCTFTDTISPLSYSAEGQNNRGHINANKPNLW